VPLEARSGGGGGREERREGEGSFPLVLTAATVSSSLLRREWREGEGCRARVMRVIPFGFVPAFSCDTSRSIPATPLHNSVFALLTGSDRKRVAFDQVAKQLCSRLALSLSKLIRQTTSRSARSARVSGVYLIARSYRLRLRLPHLSSIYIYIYILMLIATLFIGSRLPYEPARGMADSDSSDLVFY